MVDESPSDDNSVAILHPNTMEALGLFRWVIPDAPFVMLTEGCSRGDTIIGKFPPLWEMMFWLVGYVVRGKRRRDTVLICLSQDDIEEGKVAMNKGEWSIWRILS